MGKFMQTKEYDGHRPFRCPRCHKIALVDVQGACRLIIVCTRCKSRLTLEVNEPLPPELAIRAGELINH